MSAQHRELSQKAMMTVLDRTRSLFNQKPADKDLWEYARVLSLKFTPAQVQYALDQLVVNGAKFFPSCGEIFDQLRVKEPDSDVISELIANEVINVSRSWGSYRIPEAIEEMSPVAREVAKGFGSLKSFLEGPEDQINMVRSQLRKLAKACLEEKKADAQSKKLESIGINAEPRLENIRSLKAKDNVLPMRDLKSIEDFNFRDLDPMEISESISKILKNDLRQPDDQDPA